MKFEGRCIVTTSVLLNTLGYCQIVPTLQTFGFSKAIAGGGVSAKILDFLCFDIFVLLVMGGPVRNFLQNQKILSRFRDMGRQS